MPAKVLDSFALVAYFRDEPGAEAVEALLVTASKKDTPAHMTEVN
jgi:PIN domain nuclease of toxin-antitoxin system